MRISAGWAGIGVVLIVLSIFWFMQCSKENRLESAVDRAEAVWEFANEVYEEAEVRERDARKAYDDRRRELCPPVGTCPDNLDWISLSSIREFKEAYDWARLRSMEAWEWRLKATSRYDEVANDLLLYRR